MHTNASLCHTTLGIRETKAFCISRNTYIRVVTSVLRTWAAGTKYASIQACTVLCCAVITTPNSTTSGVIYLRIHGSKIIIMLHHRICHPPKGVRVCGGCWWRLPVPPSSPPPHSPTVLYNSPDREFAGQAPGVAGQARSLQAKKVNRRISLQCALCANSQIWFNGVS